MGYPGQFKAGDRVQWAGPAGWNTATLKRGVVAVVLAPGEAPPDYYSGLNLSGISGTVPRKHESYIVNVGGRAYWPRVKHLRRDE